MDYWSLKKNTLHKLGMWWLVGSFPDCLGIGLGPGSDLYSTMSHSGEFYSYAYCSITG